MADFFGIVKVNVTGTTGTMSGWLPMSAPGVKVGDRLLLGYAPSMGAIESIVTVDDEVQAANNADWSGLNFDLIFIRGI